METVDFLNVSIHNTTTQELLKDLDRTGGVVVTSKVDRLIKLQRDRELLKAFYQSNYRVCDNKLVQCISTLLGNPIKETISSAELFPAFYEYYKNDRAIKIFLLGGRSGVAEKVRQKINRQVGRDIIADTLVPSWGFENSELECQQIVERINKSGATVLAIGVGSPQQEKWIAKYKNQLPNIKIFLAIDITLNLVAKKSHNPPQFISEIGFDWLYRFSAKSSFSWDNSLLKSLPLFWLLGKQKLDRYRFSPAMQINTLPLGEILQQAGLLSPQTIRQVLQVQQQHDSYLFGEILVDRGYVSRETIDFFADRLPQLVKVEDRLRLGDYLENAGLLNNDQITSALEQQTLTNKKFGEIITQRGWINDRTLKWFVELQADRS